MHIMSPNASAICSVGSLYSRVRAIQIDQHEAGERTFGQGEAQRANAVAPA
jgi:hypothetical protein